MSRRGCIAASGASVAAVGWAFNPAKIGTGLTLSGSDKIVTRTSGGGYNNALGLTPLTVGDEVGFLLNELSGAGGANQVIIGLAQAAFDPDDGSGLGFGNSAGLFVTPPTAPAVYAAGSYVTNGPSAAEGDLIVLQFLTGGQFKLKNGIGGTYGSAISHGLTGDIVPAVTFYNTGGLQVTAA